MVERYTKLSQLQLEQYKRLPKEKKLKLLYEEEERESIEPASKVVKQTGANALFASDLLENLICSHNLGGKYISRQQSRARKSGKDIA